MIKNLENASKAATQKQFWMAEYCKRKFFKENAHRIESIQSDVDGILDELDSFFCKYPEGKKIVWDRSLQYFQTCFCMEYFGDTGTPLFINTLNVRDLFCVENFSKSVSAKMKEIMYISMEYGYFVEDLLSCWDMTKIIEKIRDGVELPDPPLFHVNKNYHCELDEKALTLLRANPNSNNKKIFIQENLWLQCHKEQNKYYEHGHFAKICGMTLYPDFIISGQALSENFDFEIAVKEIKDHIAWVIYEEKTKKNIKLTDAEEKAVVDMYERMALGEYGVTYASARAIGLWVYDYVIKHVCSGSKAIDKLKKLGLDIEHTSSQKRTLERIFKNAKECIAKGQVLALNPKFKS
ncbi:hypothetical protein [Desulfovibrio sp. TomC]|uniref:hypothetical protein n=1 Tax=Desulfovibrio sp. TomC TaxID=1562888 RepID=UPI0005B93528|nr:hypothetical protein [Desulfovibrio sp. TomC]